MKHSTYVVAVLLAACLLVVPACDWLQNIPLVGKTVQEPVVRILDLNTETVFNDARIPGALNVTVDRLDEIADGWNKDTPIITYCSDHNCMESHRAAKRLSELGFSNVKVYAGGISEWYKLSKEDKEAYPVEGPSQMAFLEKDVEILDPDKEEKDVISAEQVSQQIRNLK